MITVGSITDWVGLPVLDRDGSKISSMEAVYFDTSTEEPVFITVKVGLIGSSLVFVPLADAVVSPKDVRVAVDKKLAKDAPSIKTDGQLESAMGPAVFEYYGLVYSQGASGEAGWGAAKQLACQPRAIAPPPLTLRTSAGLVRPACPSGPLLAWRALPALPALSSVTKQYW
jgi:PRC-barrel domain